MRGMQCRTRGNSRPAERGTLSFGPVGDRFLGFRRSGDSRIFAADPQRRRRRRRSHTKRTVQDEGRAVAGGMTPSLVERHFEDVSHSRDSHGDCGPHCRVSAGDLVFLQATLTLGRPKTARHRAARTSGGVGFCGGSRMRERR